jgi:predicted TIM-barrel fold metal-dependent hydrolase
MTPSTPLEYNVTGQDYAARGHLRDVPPIVDFHAHVTRTRPEGDKTAEPALAQAAVMLDVAAEFGVTHVVTMCAPEDIAPLRERFGDRLSFNGSITKKAADAPDDDAYRLLDQFLAAGVKLLKFWSAPRGRERGLVVDAPWRVEAARRARAAGVRAVMVHVADPDRWFSTAYADSGKFGTKAEQYTPFCRMVEAFPDMTWIAAHMGGDPEHPDHLEELLERYPNLRFDTSAAKWQVREVSAHRDGVRGLICRHPDRFLFGSDLVTRHGLNREHYVSRYWCHRTLWESEWEGRSPIADPDYVAEPGGPSTPLLRGLGLPPEVLEKVYRENALRLLAESAQSPISR